MQQLSPSPPGEVSAIAISSPDPEQSLSFYELLDFHEIGRPSPGSIAISDGSLIILLERQEQPYCRLTYFSRHPDADTRVLTAAGINFRKEPAHRDLPARFLIHSPDDFALQILELSDDIRVPGGATALTLAQNEFFEPSKYPNRAIGVFGEFAVPVNHLNASIDFWTALSFTTISILEKPYPWAILHDSLSILGLHQTRTFDYPVITYFAADMDLRIQRLQEAGISDFTERSPGSVVLHTPEKQHINLFKIGA